MHIPVLIEPVAGNGYRARGGEPLGIVAEGATRAEALDKLKEQLQARLRGGAELVSLELAPEPHPLAEFAGMFKDDPQLAEWKQSMSEYRQQIDQEPEYTS
jgi:predicted RNase H-like HicB family nuclease